MQNILKEYFNIFFPLAILVGSLAGVLIVKLNKPAYFIFGLIGLVVFIGAIFSVEFGLVVLTFLTFTRLSDIAVHQYNAPSVAQFFVVLMVVVIGIRWAIYHEPPRGWVLPVALLGLYGLVGFITVLFAENKSVIWESLNFYVRDAIIAVVIAILVRNKETFRIVVWTLLISGIFLGSISAFQFLTRSFTNDYWGFANASVSEIVGQKNDFRIGGPIGDPNYFAQIMLVLVPLAFERLLHETRLTLKVLALWAFVVTSLCVIFTYSRGGFLALALAMLIFFLIYRPHIYQMPFYIAAVLFLFSILPTNYLLRIFTLDQFFKSSGVLQATDSSIRDRAVVNLTAWEMIKTHPLLGVGLSNYTIVFFDYSARFGVQLNPHDIAPHNLYLEVLSETGVIGLMAFLTMLVVAGTVVWRARKVLLKANLSSYAGLVTAFGVSMIGYMAAAFFIHASYPRYFYLFFGLALSLRCVIWDTPEDKPRIRG